MADGHAALIRPAWINFQKKLIELDVDSAAAELFGEWADTLTLCVIRLPVADKNCRHWWFCGLSLGRNLPLKNKGVTWGSGGRWCSYAFGVRRMSSRRGRHLLCQARVTRVVSGLRECAVSRVSIPTPHLPNFPQGGPMCKVVP